jgi:hypothetical protein
MHAKHQYLNLDERRNRLQDNVILIRHTCLNFQGFVSSLFAGRLPEAKRSALFL